MEQSLHHICNLVPLYIPDCLHDQAFRLSLPIAIISQCKDEDIPVWKVEYGFSCMVFGTFDEAMAFCRGKFTDLDGREV